MQKEKSAATKRKIVSAAWKLFYEQGYDETTVDEILAASNTSKGSFYHYFEGKDGLLSSLSELFDEKYEELMSTMDPEKNSFEKLIYLNQELFEMVETRVSVELLTKLLSSQLITRGERHLLDENRIYYRLLNQIAAEGQARGEMKTELTPEEIARLYAICERALMYDWCLCHGEYSLKEYAALTLPLMLGKLREERTCFE